MVRSEIARLGAQLGEKIARREVGQDEGEQGDRGEQQHGVHDASPAYLIRGPVEAQGSGGGQQFASPGVLGAGEQVGGGAMFDDGAVVHDRDLVRQAPDQPRSWEIRIAESARCL